MPLPGLTQNQIEISTGVLYRAWAQPGQAGKAVKDWAKSQLVPNIEVIGATVDVKGSQVLPDEAPTGMATLMDNLTGIAVFTVIPNYIYIDGNTTSVVLTGVGVEAIMGLLAQNEIEVFTKANLELVA